MTYSICFFIAEIQILTLKNFLKNEFIIIIFQSWHFLLFAPYSPQQQQQPPQQQQLQPQNNNNNYNFIATTTTTTIRSF